MNKKSVYRLFNKKSLRLVQYAEKVGISEVKIVNAHPFLRSACFNETGNSIEINIQFVAFWVKEFNIPFNNVFQHLLAHEIGHGIRHNTRKIGLLMEYDYEGILKEEIEAWVLACGLMLEFGIQIFPKIGNQSIDSYQEGAI